MSKKLFVGGLSWDTTEEKLRESCSVYGTILSVVIVLDKETRKSRGFGFVEFSNEAEAQAAIDGLNGTRLDGRNINLRPAVDNKNRRDRVQRPSRNREARPRQREQHNRPHQSKDNSSGKTAKPSFDNNEKRQKKWSKPKEGSSFPDQKWGEDSWGADDKWGKDRRRRREGKKKKTQYKKNNRWDDWDDG
ncbi:MAG: hypothetical protein CL916_01670 [Deltaproteobacteria bacterium]|nr:hypothetical protein [Deltaproteobacteria bacterium]